MQRRLTRRERAVRYHIGRLGNENWKISGRAEGYILRHYLADAYDAALAACGHPDPQVRFRAVWILAHTRDPRARETIVRLTEDDDKAVRYDSTVALGVLGDTRSVPHLIELLSKLEDASPAADALYRLGLAVVPLLAPLIHSENLSERHSAMNIIGHLAQQSPALLDLIALCLNDPDGNLRSDCEGWFREAGVAFR